MTKFGRSDFPGVTRRQLLAMSQVVKYVTRTCSSKPFAEVEDASCLRSGCHELPTGAFQIGDMTYRHTDFVIKQGVSCGNCHQGKHAGQLEMYSGKASPLGLPEMPSPMFLASVDCVGCHYAESGAGAEAEFQGLTEEASAKACVKCHELGTHKKIPLRKDVRATCRECHPDM